MTTLSDAELSRTLVRNHTLASLSTLTAEGNPYGSLVQFCDDEKGHPLLFVSGLAEHTHNFLKDPRASLLVWSGEADPLAHGRVTLVGNVEAASDQLEYYVQRIPGAQRYKSFKDFQVFRLRVEQARFIAGFGRMSWMTGEEYQAADPDPIFAMRAGIIAHMNEDHLDAMDQIARHLGERAAGHWTIHDADRYGYELVCEGQEPLRVAFEPPVATSNEVRMQMVAHVKQARAAEGSR